MLTQINIQGLAIIDSLTIDFSHGFNVITGETGAGKSILIKALGLLLGTKASSETVRRGREQASVSGLFEAPQGHRCATILAQYGIPLEIEAGHFSIMVRRTVNAKGRSLAWINDVPVTVHVLKELATGLIDVFAQHENQRLLDPAQHTAYLDQFVKDSGLVDSYGRNYQACQQTLGQLAALIDDFRSKRRDADYLAFRCEELKNFQPSKEDFEHVQTLSRRGGDAVTLVHSVEQARLCVDQGADGEPLGRKLWEASRILARLGQASPEMLTLSQTANNLATQLDELSYELGRAGAGLEVDEADLEAAQARLAGYQELMRKLAVHDIEGLITEHERLGSELQFLSSAQVEVMTILSSLLLACTSLKAHAEQIGKARRQAKTVVKSRIETELHELAMPGATIDLEFLPISRAILALELGLFGPEAAEAWANCAEILSGLSEQGSERAQFMLAANPGEAMLPLQKIASGGEISRIMLALKKALAAGADTCILVFDEIDSGISGRVADVVGRKMRELSQDFQVICISHLAQVAAYADKHFFVHKMAKGERTESTITRLSDKEAQEEVARLLSGDEVTPSSLANAKQLIDKARGKAVATPANKKSLEKGKTRSGWTSGLAGRKSK